MRFRYWRIAVLTVALALLAPNVAIAAEQTIDVQVLPAGTLAISVQQEVHILAIEGESTDEHEYDMSITNTTGEGWRVTVEGTDLTSYEWECDEWGNNCVRVPTDPVYTIAKWALWAYGGDADHWGDPGAVTRTGGSLTEGAPQILMWGTAIAYGSFDIDGPRPSLLFETPETAVPGSYYATLTYTIMTNSL
jgi:hypothetical protein